MTQAFRQQAAAGQIRGQVFATTFALFHPARPRRRTPFALAWEHQAGQSVSVFLPYKKGWFGRIQYGELFTTKRDAEFFVRVEEPLNTGDGANAKKRVAHPDIRQQK